MNGVFGASNPIVQAFQALIGGQSSNQAPSQPAAPASGDQTAVSPEAMLEELVSQLQTQIAAVQQQLQSAQASNDPSAGDLQNELAGLTNELQMLQGAGQGGSNVDPSTMFSSPSGGVENGGMADNSGVANGAGSTGTNQPTDATPISATGNGSQAVSIANSQQGKLAQDVSLPNYTHAGGNTNDCADFVSACVSDAGTFKKSGGDVNVLQFQSDLQKQGWQAVPQGQAKPGDVAIITGSGVQHTELVANNGATQCIGTNGTSQEKVSTDNPSSWNNGVTYYSPPKK